MQKTYKLKNSLVVQTTINISASSQEIEVSDINAFADAPNFATLGNDNNAEVIKYNGIDVANSKLTGCLRGQSFTNSKGWDAGTDIANTFTSETLNSMMDNIDECSENITTLDGSVIKKINEIEPIDGSITLKASDIPIDAISDLASTDTQGALSELKTGVKSNKALADAALDDIAVLSEMTASAFAAARGVTVNGIAQVPEEGENTGDIPVNAADIPIDAISGLAATQTQDALVEIKSKVDTTQTSLSDLGQNHSVLVGAVSEVQQDVTDLETAMGAAQSGIEAAQQSANTASTNATRIKVNSQAQDANGNIPIKASNIPIDTVSGLASTQVQAALAEILGKIPTLPVPPVQKGTSISIAVADWTLNGGYYQVTKTDAKVLAKTASRECCVILNPAIENMENAAAGIETKPNDSGGSYTVRTKIVPTGVLTFDVLILYAAV